MFPIDTPGEARSAADHEFEAHGRQFSRINKGGVGGGQESWEKKSRWGSQAFLSTAVMPLECCRV